MFKLLPLIFLEILLQNFCFSCHFFFCPPLVRGIIFVMSLQLFEGEKKKKVNFFFFSFNVKFRAINPTIPRVFRMDGPGDEEGKDEGHWFSVVTVVCCIYKDSIRCQGE